MRIRRIGAWVLLIVLFHSCVEKYFPQLEDQSSLLVVDGKITNLPGPYIITLSRSSSVYLVQPNRVSGATVVISDNAGNSEILSEVKEGIYQTAVNGLQGVPGRKYRIQITVEGNLYESSFEELKKPTPIDTVYAQVESRDLVNADRDQVGYQFYLNGDYPEQPDNKYLYEMEETFKFNADYKILYEFNNASLNEFTDPFKYFTCWSTNTVKEIYTFDTENLLDPLVKNFPLHFVSTDDKKLSIRYSVLVRQYTLSDEAYLFWDGVTSQINEQGELYSRQPHQIRGNLVNVDNPSEPVLGYFTVAGVSEKRTFINRPPEDVQFYFEKCFLVTEMLDVLLNMSSDWPIYLSETENGSIGIGYGPCTDCREANGALNPPEFWKE